MPNYSSTHYLMQPLEIELPWRPCQDIADLPEAQLICTIIKQAWEDSTLKRNNLKRKAARRWFFSKPFEEFCYLIQANANSMQKYVSSRWR